MKRIYLSALLILAGTIVSVAQLAPGASHTYKTAGGFNPSFSSPVDRNVNPVNHTTAIFYTNDFSVPSSWTFTNDVGNTDNWKIDNVGIQGVPNIGPIASTTASNGWGTFDSGLLCSGNQIGNMTTTSSINCTGHSTIHLNFQQWYKMWYDSTFVYVSNNGSTWTKFRVNQNYINDQSSPTNPDPVSVDISSVASNQPTVWIRFTFYSPASLDANAGCSYGWEIDDVSLEEIFTDDIAMVPRFPSPYALIPKPQVQTIPLTARIKNVNPNTETNIGFNAKVYVIHGGNPTLLFNGPSNIAPSLLSGDTTAILSAGNFTPTDTGLYAFLYTAFMTNADINHANDTLLTFIVVDDSTYAKDYTDINGMVDAFVGANSLTIRLGQTFDVYAAASVTSATFFLGGSVLGDTVTVSIFSTTGQGVPSTLLGTTAGHVIAAVDTFNFVTLAFVPAISVPVGKFAISLNQLSSAHNVLLGFDNSIYTPGTTFQKAPISTGPWASLDVTTFHGAYVLRPNLNLTVGVSENVVSGYIDVYPNPSNGKVYIHNNNKSTSDFVVTVFNNIGEIVYTQTYSNLVNEVIDLSDKSDGIYTIQMKSAQNLVTKSIVISNK